MAQALPQDANDFLTGQILLVDKPIGWTSFDVVNKIRYSLKKKLQVKKIKVGHAGTLDPLATGLLIIATGRFTKKLSELQILTKEYEGTLKFGATTPSFDAETEESEQFETAHINLELIETALEKFQGEIAQVPPIFSAIKKDGEALYKKARKGIEVKIEPRKVQIKEFSVSNLNLPNLDFFVECSKGTYIRSLANDLGKAVQSGAYLTRLVRTKIGDYSLEDAWDLEELISHISEEV